MNRPSIAEIEMKAQELLSGGQAGDAFLRKSAVIGRPVPVLMPGGKQHSWFIPLIAGDRLAAYFQFLTDGTFMRFSSFQRMPGVLDTCPAAADWMDPERMLELSRGHLHQDETAGEPYLTFDGIPDRIVWAVPVSDLKKNVRIIYVAGQYVYEPPPAG